MLQILAVGLALTVGQVCPSGPALWIEGDINASLYCNQEYFERGARAHSVCDGNLTNEIVVSVRFWNTTTEAWESVPHVDPGRPGVYEKEYYVEDHSDPPLSASGIRTVTVWDVVQFYLNGTEYVPEGEDAREASILKWECGNPFEDPGTYAYSHCMGPVTHRVRVEGLDELFVKVPGEEYTLTYHLDHDLLEAPLPPLTRVVRVVDSLEPAISVLGQGTVPDEYREGATSWWNDLRQIYNTKYPTNKPVGELPNTLHVKQRHYNGDALYRNPCDGLDVPPLYPCPGDTGTNRDESDLPPVVPLWWHCDTPYDLDPGVEVFDVCQGRISAGDVLVVLTRYRYGRIIQTIPYTVYSYDREYVEYVGTLGSMRYDPLPPLLEPEPKGPLNWGGYRLYYFARDQVGNPSNEILAQSPERILRVMRSRFIVPDFQPEWLVPDDNTFECRDFKRFMLADVHLYDKCVGDITPSISVTGDYDPNVPGSYLIRYDGQNSFGQQYTKNRFITVVDNVPPNIILFDETGAIAEPVPPRLFVNEYIPWCVWRDGLREGLQVEPDGVTYVAGRDWWNNWHPIVPYRGCIAVDLCAGDLTPDMTMSGTARIRDSLEFMAHAAAHLGGSNPENWDIRHLAGTQVPYSIWMKSVDASQNANETNRVIRILKSYPEITFSAPPPYYVECGDAIQIEDIPFLEIWDVTNPDDVPDGRQWRCSTGPGDVIIEVHPEIATSVVGEFPVTLTVVNALWEEASADIPLIVVDTLAPVISIEPKEGYELPLLWESGVPLRLDNVISIVALDQCEGVVPTVLMDNNGLNFNSPLPGSYRVLFSATDTSGNVAVGILEVNVQHETAATADFSAQPRYGDKPLTVHFTNLSQMGTKPITGWRWEFGDGAVSTAQDPTHTYETGGYYSPKLTVFSDSGAGEKRRVNYINVLGGPMISLSPGRVEFGDVLVGREVSADILVTNIGGDVLEGRVAPPAIDAFSITAGSEPYTLAPGETHTVTVRFAPTAIDSFSILLAFSGGGDAAIHLTGRGVSYITDHAFTVDRDFNQVRAVRITNHDTVAHEFQIETAGAQPEGMTLAFSGPGAVGNEPIALEPGESADALLVIHAQEAAPNETYGLKTKLHIAGESSIEYDLSVTVRAPASFSFVQGRTDARSRAVELRARNSSDRALTGLRILADEQLQPFVVFEPAVENGRLEANTEMNLLAVPDLRFLKENPDHPRKGDVSIEAGGQTRKLTLDFSCGAGDLYAGTLHNQMYEFSMQNWYSSSSPVIECPFHLPSGFGVSDIEEAAIGVVFEARSGGSLDPFTVRFLLNDVAFAELTDMVPVGPYEFSLPIPDLEIADDLGLGKNVVRLEMENQAAGQHIAVTDFRAVLTLDQTQLFLCAENQAAANDYARLSDRFRPQPTSWNIVEATLRNSDGSDVGDDLVIGESYTLDVHTADTSQILYLVARPDNGTPAVLLDWVEPGRYNGTWTPDGEPDTPVTVHIFAGLGHNDNAQLTAILRAGELAPWFTAVPVSGASPLVVQFTNLTRNVPPEAQLSWNFGDGATSSRRHPVYAYQAEGVYDVQLTVNYTGEALRNDYIFVDINPEPVIKAGANAVETQGVWGGFTYPIENAGTGSLEWSATVSQGASWLRVFSGARGTADAADAGKAEGVSTGRIAFLHGPNPEANPRQATVRIEARHATPFTFTVTQTPVPGTLSGYVMNTDTAERIPNARVVLTPGDGLLTTTTATGDYAFNQLEGKLYTVQVSAVGFHPFTTSVQIRNNVTRTLNVRLAAEDTELTPALTKIPDLSGKTEQQARVLLGQRSLLLGTVLHQYHDEIVAGLVVNQAPEADTEIDTGSSVTITLSDGPGAVSVKVPDLASKTEAQATALLSDEQLVLGVVTHQHHADIAVGWIICQSPAAGAAVAPSTTVSVVVSKGTVLVASEGEGEGEGNHEGEGEGEKEGEGEGESKGVEKPEVVGEGETDLEGEGKDQKDISGGCAGCKAEKGLRVLPNLKRTLDDWLLVGLALLVLMTASGIKKKGI